MAERIQRKRTKGWRMPEGAVYVGRPTKWGNPMYRVHGSPLDHHGGPTYCGLDTARHFAAKFFEWDLLNGRYGDAYPSLDVIRTCSN